MPKAGRYEYPARGLDDCIECLKRAYNVSKNESMKREVFGQALKMSSKSGSFARLVGAMAMYGLIETGGGDIQYTELAKTILHDEPNEIEQAKQKAVRSVPIFAEVYDRYGANFTEEQLRLFLRDKAAVNIAQVAETASEVGRLLKKVSPYLTVRGPGERRLPERPEKAMIDLVEAYGTVTTAFGSIKIINADTLELARKLLDVLQGQIVQSDRGKTQDVKGQHASQTDLNRRA